MPSFTLIHPTVWPQYTNVTDKQDRQWSNSIRRTVLQTVAPKTDLEVTAANNFNGFSFHFHRLSVVFTCRQSSIHLDATATCSSATLHKWNKLNYQHRIRQNLYTY